MDKDKTYPVGKVDISSEEYRDIVGRMVLAEAEADKLKLEKWKLEDRCKVLESELEELKAKSSVRDSFMRTMDNGK